MWFLAVLYMCTPLFLCICVCTCSNQAIRALSLSLSRFLEKKKLEVFLVCWHIPFFSNLYARRFWLHSQAASTIFHFWHKHTKTNIKTCNVTALSYRKTRKIVFFLSLHCQYKTDLIERVQSWKIQKIDRVRAKRKQNKK